MVDFNQVNQPERKTANHNSMLNGVDCGFVFIDRKDRIIQANKTFYELTGLLEKKLGSGLLDHAKHLLEPDDLILIQDKISRAQAGESIAVFELKFNTKLLQIELEPNDNQQGVTGIFRDISSKQEIPVNLSEITSDLAFLSLTAVDFMSGEANKIYRYIGDQLKSLIPGSIVVINSYDSSSHSFTIRSISGIPKPIQYYTNIIGKNPIGMQVPYRSGAEEILAKGELVPNYIGLHDISGGVLSPKIAAVIEKSIQITDMYSVGFNLNGKLLASGLVIIRNDNQIKDFNLINAFIHQSGIALQRQLVEESLLQKTNQQKKLLDVARKLTSSLDTNIVLNEIAVQAKTLLDCYGVTIYIIDDDANMLQPIICIDPQYDKEILSTVVEVSSSLTGKAVQSKRGMIFNNAGEQQSAYQIPGTPENEPEHLVVSPLISDDTVLGALTINRLVRKFTEEDLGLAETFASYASIAIKNANLFDALRAEIVERKSTEKKLTLTQVVTDHSFDSVFWMGPDAKIIYVNNTACERLSYSRAELMNMTVHDIDPNFPESTWEAHWQEVISKKNFIIESIHKTKQGRFIPVEIALNYLTYEGHEFNCALVRDITDRKKALEKIQDSEEKFRTAFQTSPDAIVINRMSDGVYIDVNEGFTDIIGFTREEIIGHSSIKTNIWADPAKRDELFNQLRSNGVVNNLETEFVDKAGTKHIGLMSAKIIMFNDEKHILSITRDLTAAKKAEEDRKELEAQLRQAQKMEAVGQLAGGVAHDFNNKLGGIMGYAELALSQPGLNSVTTDFLNKILERSEKAARLVKQLLAFSRQQILEYSPTDINMVITDSMKFLNNILGEHIELRVNLSADINPIHADQGALDQIITNLCLNARDAMTDGGIISLTTSNITIDEETARKLNLSQHGEYVKLSINDTGHGIDTDIRDQIFEPFFTTKKVNEGSGLGLAMVFGIMQQHKGTINFESETGKGTTFNLYFISSQEAERARDLALIEMKPLAGSETILLVEDDQDIIEVTHDLLESFGYNVLCARNGSEGLNIYKENQSIIKLVITDIVMPSIGGIELFENIRAMNNKVNFLFITGYTSGTAFTDLPYAKGTDFLYKPFKQSAIADKVRELIDLYYRSL